jgi:DNA (cytosine-5)-methyltransferase 1
MKCVDLFCGCGGLSLGFGKAGFDVMASIDNWEKAVEVYRVNFDHPCHLQDLKDETACLDLIEEYKPDILIGGPPCQDFSSAGKRDESGGRADLTYNFCNIVSSYKPKWFVMENVERIRKSHILTEVIKQLEEEGYGLSAVILNAAYCGAPQSRKRFFLIGQLGGENNQMNDIYASNLSDKPMSVRDYLGESLGLDYYYRHPRNYSRRGIFSIDEPSATVRGVNRPLPKGYSKHHGDPEDAELSETRPLTTIERSYLQTFPKSFKFEGAKTHLEQMIGNAVPVNLAQFIANGIIQFEETGKKKKVLKDDFFEGCGEVIIPERALTKVAK